MQDFNQPTTYVIAPIAFNLSQDKDYLNFFVCDVYFHLTLVDFLYA